MGLWDFVRRLDAKLRYCCVGNSGSAGAPVRWAAGDGSMVFPRRRMEAMSPVREQRFSLVFADTWRFTFGIRLHVITRDTEEEAWKEAQRSPLQR